jgi:tetratricopeptide (TPR) repeat protein
MKRLLSLVTPVMVAFLIPLRSEEPEFDWSALHKQVADLLQRGSISESETVLGDSIARGRGRNERSEGMAEALNDLGSLYHDSGRLIEAERAYRESISIWNVLGSSNPKMGITLSNLAGLRLAQGRPSDAEKLYVQAEKILVVKRGAQSAEAAAVFCGLADVYWETGGYAKARLLGERALSILEPTPDNPQLGVALFILAKTAWKQSRDEDAEQMLRRAIEVWRTTLGPLHPTVLSALVSLGVFLSGRNPAEADRLFSDALRSIETQFGPNHAYSGYALMVYARHLDSRGLGKEARKLKRRGEQILARHARENLLGHMLDIKSFQWSKER